MNTRRDHEEELERARRLAGLLSDLVEVHSDQDLVSQLSEVLADSAIDAAAPRHPAVAIAPVLRGEEADRERAVRILVASASRGLAEPLQGELRVLESLLPSEAESSVRMMIRLAASSADALPGGRLSAVTFHAGSLSLTFSRSSGTLAAGEVSRDGIYLTLALRGGSGGQAAGASTLADLERVLARADTVAISFAESA